MKNKIKALDFNELAEVEFKKGINALKLYDHENSISHLKKSVRFLKNTHNTDKYVKMLNVLGLVYTLENKNNEALDCYLESLATAEVMHSSDLKAISYSNIASCYQKMGIHEKSLDYFREAKKAYANAAKLNKEDSEMWNLLNYINIVLSGEERLFADDKFVAMM